MVVPIIQLREMKKLKTFKRFEIFNCGIFEYSKTQYLNMFMKKRRTWKTANLQTVVC
jgi:hypothetical protein